MKILESGENYLETIWLLKKRKADVRSVDIVEELGYSKSSVSRAVNILKNKSLITIDANGIINFTPEGFKKAREIFLRHKLLTEFLVFLGVSEDVAEADACRIEHVISEESVVAIRKKLQEK